MSRYKVIVRHSPNWRAFKACTLGVSVTSPNWQDDKFAAIMEFAAENFDVIRIDVTDALYRHNFMAAGEKPDVALAKANAFGSLWLAQHAEIIAESPVKPQIIRWAEWYSRPDYQDVLTAFQRAHELNPTLRDAVHEDVMGFYRRKEQAPTLAEQERGKDYLIEELAVMTLQARELASLKVYPGDELNCLRVVRAGLVDEAPKGIEREQFAKVKFHTKGAEPALLVQRCG